MATCKDPSSYHEELVVDQSPNPNYYTTMQENLDEEEDDDTFSLSDFTIFGSSNATIISDYDSLKEGQSFEFFSEEGEKNIPNCSNKFPPEDIVFCGNLILPKQPVSGNGKNDVKKDQENTKLEANSDCSKSFTDVDRSYYRGGRNEILAKRVMKGSTAAVKPRWYFYGVGLAGNPGKMELNGIRGRQNRFQKATLPGSQGGKKEESGGFLDGKGLWRLIRDLGCGGQTHANSMVKASLVCIRRV